MDKSALLDNAREKLRRKLYSTVNSGDVNPVVSAIEEFIDVKINQAFYEIKPNILVDGISLEQQRE